MFLESTAETLETWVSDHSPILMTVVEKGRGFRYNRRTFPRVHYEDLWSSYDKCKEIVKKEWMDQRRWNSENAVELFKKAAKDSMAQLRLWSKEELGDRSKK